MVADPEAAYASQLEQLQVSSLTATDRQLCLSCILACFILGLV